ncbi:hypothetical protein AK812_SmicGene18044 [Symbiodinium microadriaticum]|uniref:Uncharacterized protein n=1 Tax=Symbiodinium microadriaticum TaxID=2951 RepID=A0A1Q9DW59_SYMMI|nr:hypothetical protein AK812_SmicGene18044 [Symbiodinium microadriaticum]CAE7569149.1 unnamed protein product [Symbiodinium sp. KB8]CAE7889340.1 unnamed protein product [Symbiodinium microadriaticum]
MAWRPNSSWSGWGGGASGWGTGASGSGASGSGGWSGGGWSDGGQPLLSQKQKQNKRKKKTQCNQERVDVRWAINKKLAACQADLAGALQQISSLQELQSTTSAQLEEAKKISAEQKSELQLLSHSRRLVVTERDALLQKSQVQEKVIAEQSQRIPELQRLAESERAAREDVRLRVLIQSSEASKGLEVMRTQLEEAQRTNARLRVQQAHYMSMEETASQSQHFKMEMEKSIVDLDRHKRLVSAMESGFNKKEEVNQGLQQELESLKDKLRVAEAAKAEVETPTELAPGSEEDDE